MPNKLTHDKVKSDLAKIESGFARISQKIDNCRLSEIPNDVVIIVDHARGLKDELLLSPAEHLKIIDRIDSYVKAANIRCDCKKRDVTSNR